MTGEAAALQHTHGPPVAGDKAGRLPGPAEERIKQAFADPPPPRLASRLNRYWTPSASIVGLTPPGTLAWAEAVAIPGPDAVSAPPWREAPAAVPHRLAAVSALAALPWETGKPASLQSDMHGRALAFFAPPAWSDGDPLPEIAPDPTTTAGIPFPDLPTESPVPTPRPDPQPVAAVARPQKPEPPARQSDPEPEPERASLPPPETQRPAPKREARPEPPAPAVVEPQGDQDEPVAAAPDRAPEAQAWEERQFDSGSTLQLPPALRPTRPPAQ